MALILVAEDSAIICDVYRDMLDMMGHTPIICKNGRKAVDAFKEQEPDLVLLDVKMPEMDGIEACKQIRSLPAGRNVPIIIISSDKNENDVLRGLKAGADDYLAKPVQSALLAAKLKTLLGFAALHKEDCELAENHALLMDRYLIEKVIGYGPHSVIFLAKDTKQDDKDVAVKLLKEDFSREDIAELFVDIAGSYMKADSENLVHIYDVGWKDNRIYTAMEYEKEGSLFAKMRSRTLADWEACKLGLDVVRGLFALKKAGVLHLNVKPENIMLDDENYKLSDFGVVISRVSADINPDMDLWNKLEYISPEYLTGDHDLSARSDVYSLGIILYEAVSGDNPFVSPNPVASITRQSNYVPPPLHKLNDTISLKFSDTIVAMLKKNPEERPRLRELEEIFSKLYEFLKYASKHEAKVIKKRTNVKLPEVPASKTLTKEEDALKSKATENLNKFLKDSPISKRYLVPKVPFHKNIFLRICLIALVLSVSALLGSAIDRAFNVPVVSEAAGQGPLNAVRCSDGHDTVMRFIDINDARCPKCGKAVGIAYRCLKCGNKFTLLPIPDNLTEEEKINFEKNRYKCPKCKSMNTAAEKASKRMTRNRR